MKQYISDNRANNNIAKTIKIAEDQTKAISRYSKRPIEVNQRERYWDEGQIDYIVIILIDRELRVINRINKEKQISRHRTIIELINKYTQKFSEKKRKEVLNNINYVRLHKKMILLFELVGIDRG